MIIASFSAVISGVQLHGAITYDGFGYTVGTNLEAADNWVSLNSGTAPVIASGSLTVPGLATSTGNKVSFSSGNIQEALGSLSSVTVGTVYYSFAFSLTSQPTVSAYSFGLATSNTNYGATVWFQASGSGFNIGLAGRTGTPVYSTTVYSLNTTIFIVGAYEFVSGASNDISRLWINPSDFGNGPSYVPPTPNLTNTPGGNDLGGVSQFLIRGTGGSPAGEFDELRVGATYAAVTVPEPDAAVLLGTLGILGLLRRRR